MDGSQIYTDLLLVGKTGNGKSSTGNSILGRNIFRSSAGVASVTRQVQIEYSNIGGRIVKVVDGPGVCDTDLGKTEALMLVINCMKKAIAANPKGYHSLLLVVRYGERFTEDDKQALTLFRGIFGDDFVQNYVILVVTRADLFEPTEEYGSLQEWCANQTGVFRDLVNECRNRVVFFDNRTDAQRNEQRQILFNMVDNLSSGGVRYTNDDFRRVEQKRSRLEVESNAPIVREESMRETSLVNQELGLILAEEPQEQLVRLGQLKERVQNLRQSVEGQDRNTGALKDVIEHVSRISVAVHQQIQNTNSVVTTLAEKMRMQEEIERLTAARQGDPRIGELHQQISQIDTRNQTMQEQGIQRSRSLENEYQLVARDQTDSIISLVIEAIVAIIPMAMKIIFAGNKK